MRSFPSRAETITLTNVVRRFMPAMVRFCLPPLKEVIRLLILQSFARRTN